MPTPPQARAAELSFLLHDTGARILVVQARDDLVTDVAPALEGSSIEHVIEFGGSGGWTPWEELVAGEADAFERAGAAPRHTRDFVAHRRHDWASEGLLSHEPAFHLGGHAVGEATGVAAGERWAAAAPVGHALGFIYHTIFTLLHGATVVLVEQFSRPQALLNAIAEHQVDTFTAVMATWAAMKTRLESESADVSSLHRAYAMWQSASSSEVSDWWAARGLELLNNFGSTAFATWILAGRTGDPAGRAALGRTSPGYKIQAVDLESEGVDPVPVGAPGRMAVVGVTGLTYWNRPELQERDVRSGWTLVDDMIRFDEHSSSAHYLGRTDYVISTAGFKVAPVEVEEVLATHPDVREVAVLGAPDPIRQEIVSAFVAVKEGVTADDALRRDLQELVRNTLSPYKYPRLIEFVDALPRDQVGKLQMRTLQERLANRTDTARVTV